MKTLLIIEIQQINLISKQLIFIMEY